MESKEDRKSEPGVELIEMNKFEDDRAKIGKKEKLCSQTCGTISRSNTHVSLEFQKERRQRMVSKLFKNIQAKIFPCLVNVIYLQGVH